MSFFVSPAPIWRARVRALLVIATSLIIASAESALSQGVTELEGVTIYSANRSPTEASKVGSSVEVITEKELEGRSQTYLKDYLETTAGVSFSQFGPPGTQAGISVRGAGGKYVKVLVDGMDLSDPSGTSTETAFEHLLVGDVSRIELVKGSQSTLYGGDAIAGVINIETKRARKPGFSQSGGAEYGSYKTARAAYTAGYALENGSNVSVTAQGVDSHGFSAASGGTENDGYRNLTLSGSGEYVLSPALKVFFAARALDAKLQFDGCCPTFDSSDSVDVKQLAGRAGIEFSLLDGAFQSSLAIQGMENERDYNGSYEGTYEGNRIKGEYLGTLAVNQHLSLLGGWDWERTGATSDSVSGKEADWTGYFAQLTMEPLDGLVLTGGGRLDDHSTFGDFKTYRLTGAYLIEGTETKVRASYGTGFRVPSLDELYGSLPLLFFPNYGSTELVPETSKSWDAGVEQGLLDGKVKLGATYFELATDDLINIAFDAGLGRFHYVNVPGVTLRKGVELTSAVEIAAGVRATASYTLVDTETASGQRLNNVPRNTLVLGVDLVPLDKLALNVTARRVADTVGSGGVHLDDYLLVSAKASYGVMPGVEVYVRGENLLNEDYETYAGYGTAGASVFGGVRVALPEK